MIVIINGEKLREDMIKKGLTVTELAKRVGSSKTYISSIINGKRNPGAKIAVKICEQMKKQFDDYFFIESVHK